MRWSKIKNIIILLLVIVNLFLVGLVGLRVWRSRRNDLETRARMVAVLEHNRIAYLPGEVPGALELEGCRVTVESLGSSEVQALVGAELTGVTTVGSRTTWSGHWGTVAVSASGEAEAHFEPGAHPLNGADPGSAGLALLEQVGFLGRETGRTMEGGRITVTYVQLWNGVPLPDRTAALTWEEGALRELTMRRLAGEAEAVATPEEAIDASTALARFLEALNKGGYVCSQVTDLYAGYAVSGSGTVTLTPAWFVETDTSPWRFAVDGYTGAVTAGG